MTTPQKAQQTRLANQAEHYNTAQAKAAQQGPLHLVTFWVNVIRKLAKDALENGDPSVAEAFASHCHDFFKRHTP